jgi:ribosomal protein S18 acetylase RimI-like enzyme
MMSKQAPDFKIAAPTDVNLLLSLMQAYYAHDQIPFDEAAARLALAGLIENEQFGRTWTIWVGEDLAGYTALTLGFSLEFGGRDAYIDEIYLRPNFQGQGLGRQTIQFLTEACRQLEVKALHLEVEHENAAARAFYHRVGFEEHTRYLMTRRLGLAAMAKDITAAEATFKIATSADIETLIALMHELNEYDGTLLNEPVSRSALVQLLADSSLGGVWLIQVKDEPAGYLVLAFGYSLEYHGRDAILDEFYLRPAYRRQGMGAKAIEFAAQICQANGVGALHLEVEQTNTPAQAFYRRVGFEDHHRFLMTKWVGQRSYQ